MSEVLKEPTSDFVYYTDISWVDIGVFIFIVLAIVAFFVVWRKRKLKKNRMINPG